MTVSGGACSIMADESETAGIVLPELSDRTREALRRALPAYAAARSQLLRRRAQEPTW